MDGGSSEINGRLTLDVSTTSSSSGTNCFCSRCCCCRIRYKYSLTNLWLTLNAGRTASTTPYCSENCGNAKNKKKSGDSACTQVWRFWKKSRKMQNEQFGPGGHRYLAMTRTRHQRWAAFWVYHSAATKTRSAR
jgi:hypothetical protein